MFVATGIRMFFMICVPLFIILTGFLMCHKKLEGKYYLKIVKTLVIYILASLACLIFKAVVQGKILTPGVIFREITGFTGAPYAWYVEMYIGLFVLIPFLNLIFSGLRTKKKRLALIATCIFLTVLPQNLKYLPNWWISLYPISYYFVGCHLREYKIKLKTPAKLLILLVAGLLGTLRTFMVCHGQHFKWSGWNDHSSI